MKQLLLFVLLSAIFFAVYGTPEIEGEDGPLEAQEIKRGEVKKNKERSWQWVYKNKYTMLNLKKNNVDCMKSTIMKVRLRESEDFFFFRLHITHKHGTMQ